MILVLIGIPIMVYANPHIIGQYNNPNNPFLFIAQLACKFDPSKSTPFCLRVFVLKKMTFFVAKKNLQGTITKKHPTKRENESHLQKYLWEGNIYIYIYDMLVLDRVFKVISRYPPVQLAVFFLTTQWSKNGVECVNTFEGCSNPRMCFRFGRH